MESHCLLVKKSLLRPQKSGCSQVRMGRMLNVMTFGSLMRRIFGKVALWCLDTSAGLMGGYQGDGISVAGIKGCDLCRSGFSNHGGINQQRKTMKNLETAGKWCLIGYGSIWGSLGWGEPGGAPPLGRRCCKGSLSARNGMQKGKL